jgi:hypothetical protein
VRSENRPARSVESADADSLVARPVDDLEAFDSVKELLRSQSASFSAQALVEGFFECLSAKRDIEMVELFFSRGFDPNADLPRFTPLGAAAMCGDTELIKVMIAHGCEVNRAAGNGNTPLLSCCLRGSENRNPLVRAACVEVAKLLIERGAALSIAMLEDSDVNTRRSAVIALTRCSPLAAEVVPELNAALTDPDAAVRAGAARALGNVFPPPRSAVAPLMQILRDQDRDVRGAAVEALSAIDDEVGPAAPSMPGPNQ